jgi:hypothetical protein
MADDQGKFRIGQFAIHDVQVSAANGARQDLELNLAVLWLRHRAFAENEGLARLIENHRMHEIILAHCGDDSNAFL